VKRPYRAEINGFKWIVWFPRCLYCGRDKFKILPIYKREEKK
jgi:hypothetical protein